MEEEIDKLKAIGLNEKTILAAMRLAEELAGCTTMAPKETWTLVRRFVRVFAGGYVAAKKQGLDHGRWISELMSLREVAPTPGELVARDMDKLVLNEIMNPGPCQQCCKKSVKYSLPWDPKFKVCAGCWQEITGDELIER
jgi:hypothetical protein